MNLYGLTLGLAIVICVEIASRRNQIIPKKSENFFIIGLLVSAIIGARAYHVIDTWDYYSTHLWQIPATWQGGLGIFGALIGGFVFTYLFAKRQKLNISRILDLVLSVVPLGQGIGRFGNFFNHEVYSSSGLPVWLFESITCFILFFVIHKSPRLSPTGLYLVGYGLIRFLLEFFRADTWMFGSIKVAQPISIIFIITGLLILHANASKNQTQNLRP